MPIQWPNIFLSDARMYPDKVWGNVREPSYPHDCPNCGGIGVMSASYIGVQAGQDDQIISMVVNGHMQTGFRRYAPCPVCGGDAQATRRAWLATQSGLYAEELDKTLGNFKALPGKGKGRDFIAGLLASERPSGFGLIHGTYGAGKSHLLMATVNGWRLQGQLAMYVKMADLLERIRAGFDGGPGASAAVIASAKHAPVLCIDEIDRVKLTEWAAQQMFALLDERYRARASRLTLMATNLHPEEFGDALGYLSSRLADCTVEVAGVDMRGARHG